VGRVHPARDRRTPTQVEGIPDGHEGVAGPEGFGVGEGHYRKPACRHLDEGDVLFRVSGNDLTFKYELETMATPDDQPPTVV
jgi:hypothetical protein